jgi:hypothetical protein
MRNETKLPKSGFLVDSTTSSRSAISSLDCKSDKTCEQCSVLRKFMVRNHSTLHVFWLFKLIFLLNILSARHGFKSRRYLTYVPRDDLNARTKSHTFLCMYNIKIHPRALHFLKYFDSNVLVFKNLRLARDMANARNMQN